METIRSAIESTSRQMAEDPDAGVGQDAPATAVREDGLRFRVTGPSGAIVTDMAEAVGGGGSAPSPGWMLRAALASCDASLVAMEAARAGIELTRLEVIVTSESDFRGVLDGAPRTRRARSGCTCGSSWRPRGRATRSCGTS